MWSPAWSIDGAPVKSPDLVAGAMGLNEFGTIVESTWHDLFNHVTGIGFGWLIVMPNQGFRDHQCFRGDAARRPNRRYRMRNPAVEWVAPAIARAICSARWRAGKWNGTKWVRLPANGG